MCLSAVCRRLQSRREIMTGNATLHRRLAKLESLAAHRHAEPVYSEEDRAIMQRIVDRWYADPERHAKCIAIFEEAGARLEAGA